MANKMADKKKNASQSQTAEPKARDGGKEQEQNKSAKTVTREQDGRKERESKAVARTRESNRRDNKAPSATQTRLTRLRNTRIVRFLLEAYYELRHKVTWPTVEQARNMTIAVILLSAAVGILLGLADLGFSQLYLQLLHLAGVNK